MIIKNGRVFQEDGTFAEKDLYIEGKRFVSTKEEVIDQEVIDAKGMMVLPGLVDVHSHGAAGHDFSDGDVEGLKEILRYEKAHGITSYCPTSMTLPKDDLLKIFGTIEAIKDEPEAEVIAGVNMEGPFIDPIKKGAQAEENIVAPNAEFFRACNAASGGKIRLVTLAPNMPGSLEFIKEVSDEVMVSIGHTTADYDTALTAMKAGRCYAAKYQGHARCDKSAADLPAGTALGECEAVHRGWHRAGARARRGRLVDGRRMDGRPGGLRPPGTMPQGQL